MKDRSEAVGLKSLIHSGAKNKGLGVMPGDRQGWRSYIVKECGGPTGSGHWATTCQKVLIYGRKKWGYDGGPGDRGEVLMVFLTSAPLLGRTFDHINGLDK